MNNTGKKRRVPPLPRGEWTEAMQAAYSILSPLPTANQAGSQWLSVMVRHPEAFGTWAAFNKQLSGRPTIPPRTRELAVLRTGWLCQGAYEWGQHVPKALAAGITHDEIERVISGPDDPYWNGNDRSILLAVDDLHFRGVISDLAWQGLSKGFTHAQLIEIVMVIGNYHMIAWLHNSLEIELESGAAGLEAR